MKIHSKNILLILLLSLFIVTISCDKSEDPQISACFITTRTDSNGNVYAFNYSKDKKVSFVDVTYSIGPPDKLVYAYDDAGNVSTITYAGSNNYAQYTYDANHHLTVEEFYSLGVLDSRTSFEYNSFGQRVKIQIYNNAASGFTDLGAYSLLEYPDNLTQNPSKIRGFNTNGTAGVYHEYEYDDKEIYYANSASVFAQFNPRENNVTAERALSPSGTLISSYSYTYEYNETGFPIKMTLVMSSGGGPKIETYEYNCN